MATRYLNRAAAAVDESGESQSSRFDSDSFYTSSDMDDDNSNEEKEEGIDRESPRKKPSWDNQVLL